MIEITNVPVKTILFPTKKDIILTGISEKKTLD